MRLTFRPIIAAGFAIMCLSHMPVLAQGNSNRSSDRSEQGSSSPVQGSVSKAQTAQVGAGTTSGSTTGYSGPKDVTESAPGQIRVPPLPRPELCEPYRSTPAVYQTCLWVSLED